VYIGAIAGGQKCQPAGDLDDRQFSNRVFAPLFLTMEQTFDKGQVAIIGNNRNCPVNSRKEGKKLTN
jgi:hypothetical protein